MIFKKKDKKVTWKKNGEYFSVFINEKIIKGEIPNIWIGNDLLIIVEKLQKYYLLKGYSNQQSDIVCAAEFVAVNKNCSSSISGLIDCPANKDIDFRVKHDDGGDIDLTIEEANISVVQVGGT